MQAARAFTEQLEAHDKSSEVKSEFCIFCVTALFWYSGYSKVSIFCAYICIHLLSFRVKNYSFRKFISNCSDQNVMSYYTSFESNAVIQLSVAFHIFYKIVT